MFLYKLCLIGLMDNINKERSTGCSKACGNAHVPSELDKYIIDNEHQQTDDFIICVARFVLIVL